MSAISQKSISGITSITSPAGTDDQISLHTSNTNEALKIDGAGNLHLNNHVNTTGVTTASNFKTGTTNVHNVGVEAAGINVLGADTPIGTGATIYDAGGAVFTGVVTATTFKGDGDFVELDVDGHTNLDNVNIAGVVTATAYHGDGSDLTNLPAGLGTALSATASSPLNKMYYTNQVLGVPSSVTVDVPTSASKAYTQYADIKVESSADLIIAEGDDLIPDVLGLADFGTFGGGASAGRIRVNSISNAANDGSPTVQKGLVVTGVCTATSFSGGLPITNGADNRIITASSASAIQGEANLTYDGNKLGVNRSGTLQYGISFAASALDNNRIGWHDGSSSKKAAIGVDDSNDSLNFYTGASTTGRLRIDSDGAVNIGSNPAQATGTNTQNAILTVKGYPAGETSAAILALVRGNNTTSTAANHTMGRIVFSDKQAGEYAFIEGEAEANGAVGDTPGRLVFSTSSDNSSAPTERLRIDSTGRMTQNGTTSVDTGSALTLKNGYASNDHTILELISDPNQFSMIYLGASDDRYQGQIRYKDNDHYMAFYTDQAERMRITSSEVNITGATDGVINLNTTDSRGPFIRYQQGGTTKCWVGSGQGLSLGDVNDLGLRATHAIRMRSGDGEHAIITDDGYFAAKGQAGSWVDNTDPTNSTFHQFTQTGVSKWVAQFQTEHHAGFGVNIIGNSTANSEAFVVYSKSNNSTRFRVLWNGNCANANNSFGSLSDISIKENIVDANSQWDDIKAIKVRNFNLKNDPDTKMLGVVAQEVETVSPKLVWEDREGLKGVSYSVLYMKAIKALQEAQARIETLEAKVAALEGS